MSWGISVAHSNGNKEKLTPKTKKMVYDELSDFFKYMGNTANLKIIMVIEKEQRKPIRSRRPMYPKTIVRILFNDYKTKISEQAVYDKLKDLETSGLLISKEVPTYSQGRKSVRAYFLHPDNMNRLAMELKRLAFEIERLETDSSILKVEENSPLLKVIDGPDAGNLFVLTGNEVPFGRESEETTNEMDDSNQIILSKEYSTVSSVRRPHGKFFTREKWIIKKTDDGVKKELGFVWHVMDCGSTNGTYVNNIQLEENRWRELKDGDLIKLAAGQNSVTLTFIEN